jgi:hypothetical protein
MYNDMISWQAWNVLVVHKIEHIYLKNGYEMWLEIYEGLIAEALILFQDLGFNFCNVVTFHLP